MDLRLVADSDLGSQYYQHDPGRISLAGANSSEYSISTVLLVQCPPMTVGFTPNGT